MKCVFKKNTYVSNHFSKSELYSETRDGSRAPLMQRKHGFNTVLTVTPEGFTLCNTEGEILRRGTQHDVFNIADTIMFDPRPMYVKDELKSVEMAYAEYLQTYGFGRVERSERTKWLLYSEPLSEEAPETSATAFGLVRYDRADTYEVHSLYVPKCLSRKQRADFIAYYVLDQLNANEYASVNGCNYSTYLTVPDVRIYGNTYDHKHEQARLLYEDALKRQSSITERFDEPMQYKAQKLFDVEELAEVGEIDAQAVDLQETR